MVHSWVSDKLSLSIYTLSQTKYECTMDQELQHIPQGNDFTRIRQARGQPADTAAYPAVSDGQMS